jgi:hypothetical protein
MHGICFFALWCVSLRLWASASRCITLQCVHCNSDFQSHSKQLLTFSACVSVLRISRHKSASHRYIYKLCNRCTLQTLQPILQTNTGTPHLQLCYKPAMHRLTVQAYHSIRELALGTAASQQLPKLRYACSIASAVCLQHRSACS